MHNYPSQRPQSISDGANLNSEHPCLQDRGGEPALKNDPVLMNEAHGEPWRGGWGAEAPRSLLLGSPQKPGRGRLSAESVQGG